MLVVHFPQGAVRRKWSHSCGGRGVWIHKKSRPKGNKPAKKEKKDMSSLVSLESKKAQCLQKLSASTDRLAASMENKQRHDTWMKLAQFHREMGDKEEAMKHLAMIKEDQEKINQEQIEATKQLEALKTI